MELCYIRCSLQINIVYYESKPHRFQRDNRELSAKHACGHFPLSASQLFFNIPVFDYESQCSSFPILRALTATQIISQCVGVRKNNDDCALLSNGLQIQGECMEQFEKQISVHLDMGLFQSWFCSFLKSFILYLRKIPSLMGIYQHGDIRTIPDGYRIINLLNVILPSATNCFNIIGRYKYSLKSAFKQLYCVLLREIGKMQLQLGKIVVYHVQDTWNICNVQKQTLTAFLNQYEIVADKVLTFHHSVYFHSEDYFRVEKVDQYQVARIICLSEGDDQLTDKCKREEDRICTLSSSTSLNSK